MKLTDAERLALRLERSRTPMIGDLWLSPNGIMYVNVGSDEWISAAEAMTMEMGDNVTEDVQDVVGALKIHLSLSGRSALASGPVAAPADEPADSSEAV